MKKFWRKHKERFVKACKLGVTLLTTFTGFWYIAIDIMSRCGVEINKGSSAIAIAIALFCEIYYIAWISE